MMDRGVSVLSIDKNVQDIPAIAMLIRQGIIKQDSQFLVGNRQAIEDVVEQLRDNKLITVNVLNIVNEEYKIDDDRMQLLHTCIREHYNDQIQSVLQREGVTVKRYLLGHRKLIYKIGGRNVLVDESKQALKQYIQSFQIYQIVYSRQVMIE